MIFDDETEVERGFGWRRAAIVQDPRLSDADPNLGRRIGPYRIERLWSTWRFAAITVFDVGSLVHLRVGYCSIGVEAVE
ncbi:MAG: hypothetical protein GY856_48825 [bacterium]|nr:hypothetical protein [bacterium]